MKHPNFDEMNEGKFDHQFVFRNGLLKSFGEDEEETLLAEVQLDGDDDVTIFHVNCWDRHIDETSTDIRVEVITGKSQTTPDGEYCGIGLEKVAG